MADHLLNQRLFWTAMRAHHTRGAEDLGPHVAAAGGQFFDRRRVPMLFFPASKIQLKEV